MKALNACTQNYCDIKTREMQEAEGSQRAWLQQHLDGLTVVGTGDTIYWRHEDDRSGDPLTESRITAVRQGLVYLVTTSIEEGDWHLLDELIVFDVKRRTHEQ